MSTNSRQQPTSLNLDLYGLKHALFESEVIKDLAVYAGAMQTRSCSRANHLPVSVAGKDTSFMFLAIHAAAEFYSANETLMQTPPEVLVDISKSTTLSNLLC
jgi:hypothetical protein